MSTQDSRLKILYGVQATGQGHITRARVMAAALQKENADVDFVFTGRPPEDLYNIEIFGEFQTRRGLTFYFNNGKVSNLKTLFNNSARQLVKDIKDLDLKPYDLVITDYEPVTAWAAKLRGTPSIGIGHQYAFQHDIPVAGFNSLSRLGMKEFAPAQTGLGVHWHHFNQPILPLIFEPPARDKTIQKNKIVVYLNFEELEDVTNLLEDFSEYDFYIYASAVKKPYEQAHLKFRPTSALFKQDIEDCAGIICGAGFELATEALHMGKKLLVKPMEGQPEQLSNALALTKLGLGDAMYKLEKYAVSAWLQKPEGKRITYPDTASAVVKWITEGRWNESSKLFHQIWQRVDGLENMKP
ncbi:MAG: MJ1255/VC2487 family glycosyltransferase [Micavibrio sp.]